MRYAYVKNNNAVREIKRVGIRKEVLEEGGPDAYVASFFKFVGENPCLVLSIHGWEPQEDEIYREKNICAISYYRNLKSLNKFGVFGKSNFATLWPRIIKSIRIFIRLLTFRPDRILCWTNLFPLWATYVASLITSARLVISIHSWAISSEKWYQSITGRLDKWIIENAHAVICHGPYLKAQLKKIGVKENKIFEYNWNFNNFGTGLEHIENNEKDLFEIILFIGRMIKGKGIFDFFEACKDRLKKEDEFMLWYAGDGDDMNELRIRIESDNLLRKVKILGRVPHNELASIIKKSKVVVTPTQGSYPEGRCMATMEGLLMGRPVIAPDFGPFPYLVKHGINGLLYKTDSINDLGKKIDQTLDEQLLYEKLCKGADETGKEIRNYDSNYYQAVVNSFSYVN